MLFCSAMGAAVRYEPIIQVCQALCAEVRKVLLIGLTEKPGAGIHTWALASI